MKLTTLLPLISLSWLTVAFHQSDQTPVEPPSEHQPTIPHPPMDHSETPPPPSYRRSLLSLHRSLIEIESVTGHEHTIGTFLSSYLTNLGYQTKLTPLPPSPITRPHETRHNVLAWSGSPDLTSVKVIISSHIDTVPPHIPYSISSPSPDAETIISGRGSVDAKAAVAAQIIAVDELVSGGLIEREDVALLYVVGEETTGDGMRKFSHILNTMKPKPQIRAAIFGEPTENKLACGHKGHVSCEIMVHGKAGHSGYPWLGKSANEVMITGLTKLLEADLGKSDKFGDTTVNVGVLEGGVASNVIPEFARAELTIRVAIGPQDRGGDVVVQRLRRVLEGVDEEAFHVECANWYGVVECECDVDGFESDTMNYGTDIPNFKADATRYLYGPGTIFVAHSDHEALKLGELEESVEGYKKLILHALKKKTTPDINVEIEL